MPRPTLTSAGRRRSARRRASRVCRLERLEPRQLLAVQVLQPLGQQYTWEDGHDTVVDLRQVFESDRDALLGFTVVDNSRTTLVQATTDSWYLRVQQLPDQHGEARITVRAEELDSREFATDTLTVTTVAVNDAPAVRAGLPELTVQEGQSATLDLTLYFQDTEEAASRLAYCAVPFDASDAGNPIASASVQDGILTLQASPDGYGYVAYAVSAHDSHGGQVATTLHVLVEPVNDAPVARRLPDRAHKTLDTGQAPLVVIDLWHQHLYENAAGPYFNDAEDGPYLSYSVAVSDSRVFQAPPTIDAHSFLLYCPTVQPGFVGSATVTITARDREGLAARLADGTWPSFQVTVDNRSTVPAGSADTRALDAAESAASQLVEPPYAEYPLPSPPSVGDPSPDYPGPVPPPGSPYPAPPDPGLPYPGYPTPPPGAIYPTPEPPYPPYPPPPPPGSPYPGFPDPGIPYPGYPAPPPPGGPYPGFPDPGIPGPGYPPPPPPGSPYPGFPDPGIPGPGYPPPPPPSVPGDPSGPEPSPPVPAPVFPAPVPPDPVYPAPPPFDPPTPGIPATPPPPDPGSGTPPTVPPPPPPPSPPPATPRIDLELLGPRVADVFEETYGALVAVHRGTSERNCGTGTMLAGPHARPVTILTTVPDNEPDRGLVHRIGVGWQWSWDSWSETPWRSWSDETVRPARFVSHVAGTVEFDVPEGVLLWVPAWALYGPGPFMKPGSLMPLGARWIRVRPGERYRVDGVSSAGGLPMGDTLPLAIEGLHEGTGHLTARFTPTAVNAQLSDAVKITVVGTDLDIDADNDDPHGIPSQSMAEEQVEDHWRSTGRRIVVNADDADGDLVPDFVDGFNLDGRTGAPGSGPAADDRTEPGPGVGFVPLVVELSPHIDPRRALLRFQYLSADPLEATVAANGNRQVPRYGIRVWSQDESVPRRPRAADDPESPGHFVASYFAAGNGFVAPRRSEGTYTMQQLTGNPLARRCTLYVEGVVAGQYTISVLVDPDGRADAAGGSLPDLFPGFLLRDTVRVTVESEVRVSAINAVGAETDDPARGDVVQFEISRQAADTRGGALVFYRLHTLDTSGPAAIDPAQHRARADYDVWLGYGDFVGRGLVGDAYTQIGGVWIPDGSSSAVLTIVPRNDAAPEWDESVTLELIEWDDFRRLHDEASGATPNDGLPGGVFTTGTLYRSCYRLARDAQAQLVGNWASASLLDNDALVGQVQAKPPGDDLGVAPHSLTHGHLTVDVHGGQAAVVLPVWGPSYREDDHLRPIVETVVALPPVTAALTRLSAVCTVAGFSGEPRVFDATTLDAQLAAAPGRQLRLVVVGPEDLSERLSSGHYDADVVVAAEWEERTWTRTARLNVDLINRVDDDRGTSALGQRWTLNELHQLVLADGLTAPDEAAARSRLGPRGARTESGALLVRGDNATTWFAAPRVTPGRLLESCDSSPGSVTLSDPGDWIGNAGEGGARYRTAIAGLRQRDASVTWHFGGLSAGHVYQVFVHWDAAPLMASNAVYRVHSGSAHRPATSTLLVDQRYVPGEQWMAGRAWRSLGFYTPLAATDSIDVSLGSRLDETHYVDGLLSAGAVMLVEQWEFASPDSSTATLTRDSESNQWQLLTKAGDRYRFDAPTGRLESREDRQGNQVLYRYADANGDGVPVELAQIVRQGGLTTTLAYAAGKLSRIVDFAGRETQWTLSDGQVVAVTAPEPGDGGPRAQFQFAYDSPDGLLTQVRDPRGFSSHIERDAAARRVKRVTNPDGAVWSLIPSVADGADGVVRLPATGRVGAREVAATGVVETRATYVDPRGNAWLFQTDTFGQLTAEARPPVPGSPQQDVWRWDRDARGLVHRSIAPAGGGGDTPLPALITRQEFDSHGNLRRRETADGSYEEWWHEPVFHQVRDYRDAAGRRTRYEFDARGNVTTRIERERQYEDTPDRLTRFAYTAAPDTIGQLPGGLLTRQIVAADSPDAVTTEYEYWTTAPHVGLVQAIHEVVGATDPEATGTRRFTYDQHRNPLTETDVLGRVTSWVYDPLNRRIRQTDPDPGTGDHAPPVTTHRYDAAGNAVETVDPRGTWTRRTFDAMNRLTSTTQAEPGGHSATDPQAPVTCRSYDANGNVVRDTDPLGRSIESHYDARNQQVRQVRSGPVPVGLPMPPQAPVPAAFTTTTQYDTLGNVRAVANALGALTTYQYDVLGRLTRITAPDPGTGQHPAPLTYRMYDAAGRLTEQRSGAGSEWRVTTYRHDDLGRLRCRIDPVDGEGRRPQHDPARPGWCRATGATGHRMALQPGRHAASSRTR
ncbi:MAG: hypothetical protein MUF48_08710 [Pirellulaceae bacterium]|nr:hypothetical protein [Pirellulaceae bacterium]